MSAVAQARLEDTDAFTELAERYQRNIFRLAQNITQNREDAEDVLQETFLKAYQHLPEFEGHSKFYTWIVRIAVNEALMKLRKRKWDKTVWLD
jgi:RNA polymerase sigma-70 factor (ECF subfamily)